MFINLSIQKTNQKTSLLTICSIGMLLTYFAIVLSSCSSAVTGFSLGYTTNQYQGRWWKIIQNDSNQISGYKRIQLEIGFDSTIKTVVARKGLPDFIYVESTDRIDLVYVTEEMIYSYQRTGLNSTSYLLRAYSLSEARIDNVGFAPKNEEVPFQQASQPVESVTQAMVSTSTSAEIVNSTSTSLTHDFNNDSTFPQNKGRNLIKGIQISLQGLGYPVENISGELDLSTISLIKKFQSEHDLVVDGIPTIELLNFSFSLRKESKLSNIGCSQRKNCSELASCEEALYYLNVCGDGRLDHNNSGIPCEESACSYSNRIARPTPAPTPTPVPALNPSPSFNTNKPVEVKGYYRKDGTYVRPHTRNAPRKK